MDCDVPVDDLITILQPDNFTIPKPPDYINVDSGDSYLCIVVDVETMIPWDEYEHPFFNLDDIEVFSTSRTYWEPCHRSLSHEKISGMLLEAGVPVHKQYGMPEQVAAFVDEVITKHGSAEKIIPILVQVDIVACFCVEIPPHLIH
ncbi:hypothetical protein M569_13108 [Genlisea aurea]|uniref:Uncharacterized protein n=1 Tax=Genlisea aurea TaxID=192259 RepID=S8DPH6_9LAMI|nr:hypothetical protein M569_13108 [Genlisea aurea]